jgi:hypothetical protein
VNEVGILLHLQSAARNKNILDFSEAVTLAFLI